jgi:hypothetical protein
MEPAHAPLPTACSLPFHPASGNQTSDRMSESADGAIRSCTRQNAGSAPNGSAARGPATPGSVKRPASTDWLAVTVVWASVSVAANRSHAAGATGGAWARANAGNRSDRAEQSMARGMAVITPPIIRPTAVWSG